MPSRPVALPYRTTRLPGPSRRGVGQHPVLEQSDRHHVDQRVALVGRVEHELAADGGHADAVAVAADAPHHAIDQVARPRVRRGRRTAARRGPRSGGRPWRRCRAGCRRRRSPRPGTARRRDGWLWLSILNATASPSPIAMTPACSPTPATTSSPLVGRVRSSGRELLYEQCSLHITENIASSRSLGSRPSSFSRIASSSTSVSPRTRCSGAAPVVMPRLRRSRAPIACR